MTETLSVQILPDIQLRTSRTDSLNRLCDMSDWRVGGYLTNIMQSLGEGAYIHRKSWEYSLCIYGLEKLGAVTPTSSAIAIGAGYERPLYYFANKIDKMVATDLYDDEEHEGKPSMLDNPTKYAPFAYRKEHLEVRRMDGLNIEYEDNTFDFAFSLSSIEHFGSRANTRRSVEEMQRVLKPGGVMSLATELILNDAEHDEYFTIEELQSTILDVRGLELVGGELDLCISRSLVENPIDLDEETELHVSPHIVLKHGDVIWTSVMLFLQK
jgi:SAM-dependent methyltransferase